MSGSIDVEMGGPAQTRNDYLQTVLGPVIPAYRGIAALVLRGFYMGNNPYIKAISAKWTNCRSHYADWYPEKCVIARDMSIETNSIYIAVDIPGSMCGSKQIAQKAAVTGFIDSLRGTVNSIKIVTYDATAAGAIERFDCTDADYDALIAFVATISDVAGVYLGTDYDAAVSLANQFYLDAEAYGGGTLLDTFASDFGAGFTGTTTELSRRVLIFLADGEPAPQSSASAAAATLAGIEGVEVFAINIELTNTTWTQIIDNTSQDGVPVISGGDSSALQAAIGFAFTTYQDINPAHILRDVILNPASGGTGDASEIGDTFATAADTLYSEGFGLSLYWENGQSRDEFQQIVERHIDGNVYVDRQTGKWEIKLIRDDCDAATQPVFDASNILKWQEVSRPQPAELPNYVTLTYTRREDGEPATVPQANLGALQATGRVIAEKVDYPGITRPDLASQVALRDCIALTTPLWTGACEVAYLDPSLNKGSVIKINEPRLGLNNVVVRLTEIEESDGRDTSALIRFAEDAYALPADVLVASDTVSVADASTALPGAVQLVEEIPYYIAALQQGQADLDADLAAEPDLGYFHATESRPNGFHINAKITVNTGGGWVDTAITDYAPALALVTGLSAAADDVTCEIENDIALAAVTQGSLCAIGGEYLRVDNLVANGATVTATFGRACLDTAPARHNAGAVVIFFQGLANSDEVQFLATEEIDVKLRGKTGLDEVKVGEAPTVHVTFAGRASRPYPVGQLKVEASYAPPGILGDVAAMTWAHRDRQLQTTLTVEDHTTGNIGPEAGVSYHVLIRAVSYHADFFAHADFFVPVDFFTDETSRKDLSEVAVSPPTDLAYGASTLTSDFFARADFFAPADFFEGSYPPDMAALEFGDRTDRGSDSNWQTPFVRGVPLIPAINLKGVSQ